MNVFSSCKTETVPLKQQVPIPPPPAPGNHPSTLCLYEFAYSRDLM